MICLKLCGQFLFAVERDDGAPLVDERCFYSMFRRDIKNVYADQ